jgi:hypothetical protein
VELSGKNIRLRVFENGVLRGVFGCEREELTVERENCIMRSFVIICCSPNIQFIRSGRTRWAGHVARMEEK